MGKMYVCDCCVIVVCVEVTLCVCLKLRQPSPVLDHQLRPTYPVVSSHNVLVFMSELHLTYFSSCAKVYVMHQTSTFVFDATNNFCLLLLSYYYY